MPGGDVCRPLDWIPEVHHPLGGGEAVIPDALLYYRRGREGDDGAMLRAFVEVDRATMGPERLAAKLTAYAHLHSYTPQPVGRRPAAVQEWPREEWRRSYPLFPWVLFVLDSTGPNGVATRIDALRAAATQPAVAAFLADVPVLAAPLVDVLQHGPSGTLWHPINGSGEHVGWM